MNALRKMIGRYFPDAGDATASGTAGNSSVSSSVSGETDPGFQSGKGLASQEMESSSRSDLASGGGGDRAKTLLAAFEKVTDWAEPQKRGARTYDDKAFVASIREQFGKGKTLSPKQIAALEKLAVKYSL